jgi:hypothetical protein
VAYCCGFGCFSCDKYFSIKILSGSLCAEKKRFVKFYAEMAGVESTCIPFFNFDPFTKNARLPLDQKRAVFFMQKAVVMPWRKGHRKRGVLVENAC